MRKRYVELALGRDGKPFVCFMERRGSVRYLCARADLPSPPNVLLAHIDLVDWALSGLLPGWVKAPATTEKV